MKYFHIFGSKCYILNDREKVRKFEPKSDEGIFLGYSPNSRAYRVYNKRIKTVQESINVIVDDQPLEPVYEPSTKQAQTDNKKVETIQIKKSYQ